MSMNIKVLKRARVLTKRKYIEDLDRAGYTEEEKAERLEFYDNTISLGIDPVTGLPGRYLMVQNIEHELARLKRHGDYHHFSVALFDLDDLTEVNNEYGHSGGDKFLKRAARVLVDGSRETDYAYKATGGDEFLLVLPRADEESTKIVLDRIRKIGKDRRDLFRSRVLDAKKELKNTDDISKLKYSYR